MTISIHIRAVSILKAGFMQDAASHAPSPVNRIHHDGSPTFWTSQVLTILLSSFIFILFPAFDLAVSRFFARGYAFPLSDNSLLLAIRDINRRATIYLVSGMIGIALLYAINPHRFGRLPPHKAIFVLLTFLLGPLLTVQALKNSIGRARPRSLVEFGGSAEFTPLWQVAEQCTRNCSFPSGEAATAAASLAMIVFVPKKWRRAALAIMVPVAAFTAVNRVMFGAHFLSDVVVAWGLMLCLMIWLWSRIAAHAQRIDASIANLGRRLRH
ncbi:phosphatase PAP2 family protein [Brucella pseudogrignonensis]